MTVRFNRLAVRFSLAVVALACTGVLSAHAQVVDDGYENARRNAEEQRRNDELAAQQQPQGCPDGARAYGNFCAFPEPPSYGAIASHLDASDVWVSGVYPNQDSAMNAALNACNRVMGGGCEAGWTVNNGTAVVGRGADGRVVWAVERTRAAAQRRLDALCRRHTLGCTSLGAFNGRSEFRRGNDRFRLDDNIRPPRDLTNVRMLYAASASLSGADFDRRVWVASGFARAEEAQEAAVQACRQAAPAGKNCQRTVAVGNGVMMYYLLREASGATFDSYLVEQNEARGRQAIAEKCRQERVTCTVTAVDDSRVRAVKLRNFAQPNG